MNKKTHALLSVALIVFCASLHAAEKIMYKWTDSNGEIHYTERAPKGIEYTRIKTYVDSSSTGPVKTNSTSSQDEKVKDGNSTYNSWRDENCTMAKQNLDILTSKSRIGVDDGQGGKRLMSDEEKQAQVKQMEQQRDKYCSASEDG